MVSARTQEAPPCKKPYGWRVLAFTGIDNFKKSSPISRHVRSRNSAIVLAPIPLKSSREIFLSNQIRIFINRLSYNRRKKFRDVTMVSYYITNQSAGDGSVFRKGGKKNCFHIIFQTPVHISDRFFIFEIIHVANAAQNKISAYFLATG